MNLCLTDEQTLLKDTFARFFQLESTPERVRSAGPEGFDRALWAGLVEMGAHLARVPEQNEGLGLSLLDAAILAEEAGRRLASVPLVEVVVTGRLLAELGNTAAEWLERLAGGTVVVLAIAPAAGGRVTAVPGGAVAEGILLLDGDELVVVSAKAAGAPRANSGHLPVADFDVSCAGPDRTVLASGQHAIAAFEAAVIEWKLLSAAYLAGLARQALELAAAYACEREQFGRPIGSFQGIAHPLADAVSDIEGGQLLVWKAIAALSQCDRDAAALSTLAWWWLATSAKKALRPALRTLGGYGLSLEYDLQLYHRRGTALALLAGDADCQLILAGDLLFGRRSVQLPESGEVRVDFSLGEEAQRHADRLNAFFDANWDERLRAKGHHSSRSHDREFHRRLAAEGLIFGGWPAEHGGAGHTPADEFATTLVFEQWNYTSHVLSITNMVGQTVMRFGSSEARQEILPKIKQGEAICSLGFSEPGAGSDVFAAKTFAVRSDDGWLINGQKMFTTAAQYADYVLLLARTDSSGRKHEGLTLFIVPTDLPGYECQGVETYQDERTNITFFTDLYLPDRFRIGGVGEGASVLSAVLSLEHGGANYFSGQSRMWRNAVEWASAGNSQGTTPLDDPWVRARLARVRARLEVADCLVVRGICGVMTGDQKRHWGSMAKLFVTESFVQSCSELLEIAGSEAIYTGDHPLGVIELDHRRAYGSTIYGGTSEIHRSVVAEQALGLPKSRS